MKKNGSLMMALALGSCFGLNAQAQEVRNGGDTCESRILDIRNNILSWIAVGNYQQLRFPENVKPEQYRDQMLYVLATAKVSCTSQPVLYTSGGATVEKACENVKTTAGELSIRCNAERFVNSTQPGSTIEEDQYRLVHHEYAGLAGLEVNRDIESQYSLSNQIAGKLENVTIKRLPIVKAPLSMADTISCNYRSGIPGAAPAAISTSSKAEFKDWARAIVNFEENNPGIHGRVSCGILNSVNGALSNDDFHFFDLIPVGHVMLRDLAVKDEAANLFTFVRFFHGYNTFGVKSSSGRTPFKFLLSGKLFFEPKSFKVKYVVPSEPEEVLEIESLKPVKVKEMKAGLSYLNLGNAKVIPQADGTILVKDASVQVVTCKNRKCTNQTIQSTRTVEVRFDSDLNLVIQNW